MKVGPSIVDIVAGLFASNGITAALYRRTQNGGLGQQVDVALLDSVVAAMSHYAQIYLVSGVAPPRRGTAGNGGIPSQMFTCKDGAIMLTAGNDAQFGRLCEVLERPDLKTDPRYATNNARVANRKPLTALLDSLFNVKPVAIWLEALEAADVPSGPINDLGAVFADKQVQPTRHAGGHAPSALLRPDGGGLSDQTIRRTNCRHPAPTDAWRTHRGRAGWRVGPERGGYRPLARGEGDLTSLDERPIRIEME